MTRPSGGCRPSPAIVTIAVATIASIAATQQAAQCLQYKALDKAYELLLNTTITCDECQLSCGSNADCAIVVWAGSEVDREHIGAFQCLESVNDGTPRDLCVIRGDSWQDLRDPVQVLDSSYKDCPACLAQCSGLSTCTFAVWGGTTVQAQNIAAFSCPSESAPRGSFNPPGDVPEGFQDPNNPSPGNLTLPTTPVALLREAGLDVLADSVPNCPNSIDYYAAVGMAFSAAAGAIPGAGFILGPATRLLWPLAAPDSGPSAKDQCFWLNMEQRMQELIALAMDQLHVELLRNAVQGLQEQIIQMDRLPPGREKVDTFIAFLSSLRNAKGSFFPTNDTLNSFPAGALPYFLGLGSLHVAALSERYYNLGHIGNDRDLDNPDSKRAHLQELLDTVAQYAQGVRNIERHLRDWRTQQAIVYDNPANYWVALWRAGHYVVYDPGMQVADRALSACPHGSVCPDIYFYANYPNRRVTDIPLSWKWSDYSGSGLPSRDAAVQSATEAVGRYRTGLGLFLDAVERNSTIPIVQGWQDLAAKTVTEPFRPW